MFDRKRLICLLIVVFLTALVGGGEARAGGGYQLTGQAWSAPVLASGGAYQLLEPASPGDYCCCLYIPCVRR